MSDSTALSGLRARNILAEPRNGSWYVVLPKCVGRSGDNRSHNSCFPPTHRKAGSKSRFILLLTRAKLEESGGAHNAPFISEKCAFHTYRSPKAPWNNDE